jgi:hypothetical protein
MKSGIALAVVMVLTATVVAHAETEEGRQACINDAFQFCQDVFPDHERVFRCLEARKASLSPACRAQMTPAAPAVPPATTKQALPPRGTPHRAPAGKRTLSHSEHPVAEKHAPRAKAGSGKTTGRTLSTKPGAKHPAPQGPKPLNIAPR